MPRKTDKPTTAIPTPPAPPAPEPVSVVAKGADLGVPARKSVPAPTGKVGNVRGRPGGPRKIDATAAGRRSGLFPKGGEAFAAWVRSEHGIDPTSRQDPAFWEPYLTQFAERPVSGHRRRTNGNHKSNRIDIR